MATTRKPAPKRRGPTKAAALKALGLTQEDLDTLKAVAAARNATTSDQEDELLQEAIRPNESPEYRISQTNDVQSVSTEQGTQTFFARNLRGMEVGIRLERQSDQKTKRLDFKPRGERGDIKQLQPGDLSDPNLLNNIELGVIEIITAPEAKKAIEGQAKNEQTRVHPAMSMLRNELGQEYAEGAVKGADQYVDEGVVVAELNPVGGEFGEIQFSRQNKGSFQRATGQAPESGRNLGGNPAILSDGFAAARAADEVARQKNIEGPAAGLGGIQTVVVGTPKQVVTPPKPGE